MLTLTNRIDMRPGAVPLVIHLGQYDSDFSLVFELYSSAGNFTVESGTTAMIRGTKTDGNAYDADATIDISAKTVTVAGSEQMTAAKGRNVYELVLTKSGKVLSTANFILDVERAAMDADTIASESVLKELNAIIAGAETATEAAQTATAAADSVSSASAQIATNTADIADLKEDLNDLFPDNAKQILLQILKQATYLSDVENLIDNLETAILSGIVTVGPSGIITIANAKAGVPISLKLDVAPVQNLHGYEHPWAGGSGKNIVPYFSAETKNGITLTVDDEGVLAYSGTSTAVSLFGRHITFDKDCVYFVNGAPSLTNAGFTVRDTNGSVANDNGIIFGTADFNGESGRISCAQAAYDAQLLTRIGNGVTIGSDIKWYPMIVKEGENNHLSSLFASGSKDGITFTVDNNGIITINGTNESIVTYGVSVTLPAGNYVIGANRTAVLYLKTSEGGDSMSTVEGFEGNSSASHRGGVFSIDREMTMWCGIELKVNTHNNEKVYPIICDRIITNLDYAPYSNICPFTKITDVSMKHGSSASSYQTETFDVSAENYYGGNIDFVAQKITKVTRYASYAGEALTGKWASSMDNYAPGTLPTIGAEVLDIATQNELAMSVNQISLLEGSNRLWSDDGDITLTYEKAVM